jgi:two-component system, LuxR family, sensor histidine kinase DctS
MMQQALPAHDSRNAALHPCAKVRSGFAWWYAILARSMTDAAPATLDVAPATRPLAHAARRWRRALLWGLLVALLAVAQTLLVLLALNFEATRVQDRAEAVAAAAAAEVRQSLARSMQSLQSLLWNDPSPAQWRRDAGELVHARRQILHVELRDAAFRTIDAAPTPYLAVLFAPIPREALSIEAEVACAAARRSGAPAFSRSYFVPQPGGYGLEVIDLCIPRPARTEVAGSMVATFSLSALLEDALAADPSRGHELSFVEGDGARLARAGSARGAGVYRAEHPVDVAGATLRLRADSTEGRPHLIPNLNLALVVGLSIALFALVLLLARDVRRRAAAEERLAEALAFRKAMEDSLVTGLRARDLAGRITYVNPAFCRMVGYSAEALQQAATPPYWPPERVAEYSARQAQRLGTNGGQARPLPASAAGATDARVGNETVFMRQNGERFPVMIYEAPLVDSAGRHSGWMSTALDLSDQRRVEELSRQQQERLQATARLATVGEMASLLSHELNQPLAAIASYASGSLNLLDAPAGEIGADGELRALLRQSVGRIAEQAERAGRTIKSVHDFVRRREQSREAVSAALLIDAVLPLVRLQARKSGTRVEVDLSTPVPRVLADRTMVEQVLLNLARNGIQAMESEATPLATRVLHVAVHPAHGAWVEFSVSDAGPGIAPDVAQRLFTPFFTTRSEGMGLGLSLCRTVIEQHGGALDFSSGAGGTTFRFTLPAAP